jgi:hypothetical protein
VTTLTEREWIREALIVAGCPADSTDVEPILKAIAAANGDEDRLGSPGVDSDPALHHRTTPGGWPDPPPTWASAAGCARR